MDSIASHLEAHHGVISRTEAERLGMSSRTIGRRVEAGVWKRLYPGVFRIAGAPPTWNGTARAAALASRGLISHRAAARVWAIDGYERAPVELTIGYERRSELDGRSRIHRSKQMSLAGRTQRLHVPVTGLARTVLDLAAVAGRRELNSAVDSVIRSRRLRWHDLMGVLVRHSSRGRDGCGKLRTLLNERYGERRPPDSVFNRMVSNVLVDASVGRPDFEHEIRRNGTFIARVDLAFPADRLAIELDSRAHHDNDVSFVADRRRANRIVNEGWTLLSFTWDDYSQTPHVLVQTVRDALRRLRSAPS